MDRLVLSWNFPGRQVCFDVEFSLWTGWHCLEFYWWDRLAFIWNFPYGQVGIVSEFSLWRGLC